MNQQTPPQVELDLQERKRQFVEAVREVDVLKPLKAHPWVTVGGAVTLGVLAGSTKLSGSKAVVAGSKRWVKMLQPLLLGVGQFLAARHAAATAAEQAANQVDPVTGLNPRSADSSKI